MSPGRTVAVGWSRTRHPCGMSAVAGSMPMIRPSATKTTPAPATTRRPSKTCFTRIASTASPPHRATLRLCIVTLDRAAAPVRGDDSHGPGRLGSVVVHVYRVDPVVAVGRHRDAEPVAGRLVQQVVQPPLGGVVPPVSGTRLQDEPREVTEAVVADLGDLAGDPPAGTGLIRLVARLAAVLRVATEHSY